MSYQAALITGASSGIGKALATQLARRGVAVGLIARRADLLKAQVEEITAEGGRAVYCAADVSDLEAMKTAYAALSAKLGFMDLVVANAGIAFPIKAKEFDAHKAAQIYRVNVFGVLNTLQVAMVPMTREKRGHFVGISSLASYHSLPMNSVYCATKSAVSAQLEGLRLELRRYGVDVTTICPGFINTPILDGNTASKPMMLGVDIAAEKMIAAIYSRKKVYNFPFPMHLLVRLSRWLPDAVLARLSL